jgi:hypothetical protein
VISGLSEDQVAELAFLLERVIAGLDHADL